MTTSAKRIMIVTGEASGDLHGANLIDAVRATSPEISFFGVGGPRMAAAGCDILIPGEELSVMGIAEVVGHFPLIWRSFQRLKNILHGSNRPDALVLIDFPDFNLRLARQAKKARVPVLYYVSPQVWAWRRGRVKKIARVVNALAAIFPFEPAFYQSQDILVKYVGHPLLDEFAAYTSCGDLKGRLQIPAGRKVIGLFPGSRRHELHYMLATLADSATLMLAAEPDAHFLIPVADTLTKEEIRAAFPDNLPASFVAGKEASIYDVAASCDTILSVSGTVTLQIALVGTPMAILYKMSGISYAIARRLVRVEHIGLPNIVAGARIVPEFIQDEATPQALAEEALRVLKDADHAGKIRQSLGQVRDKLGQPGCSRRVAGMLIDLVQGQPAT